MGYKRTLGKSINGLGINVSISLNKTIFLLNIKTIHSSDPHSSLVVEFGSKEDAIIYCERMG
jgi:hypothetical protein